MPESHSNAPVATVISLVLIFVLLLALILGGAAVYVWQRQRLLQQQALMQRELAQAEAVRAEAIQRQMAEAAEAIQRQAAQAAEIAGTPSLSPDAAASIERAIRAALQSQQEAWNGGDIPAFMEYYWPSDQLTFNSDGTLTRGWQDTLQNYQRRYPTSAAMGQLAFNDLEVTPLGPDAALVLGQWQLSRDGDRPKGSFTLVFRRVGDRWRIIHDHTSRSE